MMKKLLKGLLWLFVGVIVLSFAAALALPHFVPMSKVEALVKQKVREATGRDLAFKGAKFVFWPDVGVRLTDVSFSNPAWARQKNMVALGEADVALAVQPLLNKQIVVKRFILNAPDIDLEVSKDGQRNWDFSKVAPAKPAETAQKSQPQETIPAQAQQFKFHFGQMRIDKGRLVFTDMQKGQTVRLSDVDVNVKWPEPESPLHIDGALTYKGKRITLALDLDRPMDFLAHKESNGQASMKADDFSVKTHGAYAAQGLFFNGTVDADMPDLASVLTWIRGDEKKLPFRTMAFKGDAGLSATGLTLQKAALSLDDVQAKGDASVSFANKPEIVARLSLNKLDLDRFTGGKTANAANGGAGEQAAAQRGWDTTPLDFSGLKAVNADLRLDTQGFTLRGIAVGPSVLTVKLQNGLLKFSSSDATLLGGRFSSGLALDAARAVPAMSFAFNMSGVEAQPILATFAHFKKLSGTATAHVDVTASGDSQKAVISSLAGKGDFDFKNGELKGIDMVRIAQLVQAHSSNTSVGAGTTKFVDMTGTFTISRGVASNNDLKVEGAVLRATGHGTIDLPQKYIRYRVTPVLLAGQQTAAGQAGGQQQSASGLTVPVNISGPFDHIRVIPDFAAAIGGIVANPSNARQTIKNIRNNFKQNPVGTLENLLGNGGLFGRR